MAAKKRKRRSGRPPAGRARPQPAASAGPRSRPARPKPAWQEPPASPESPEIARLRARLVGGDGWRARIEDQVVVLVNEARRRHGQPPLRVDERLRGAARAHSSDMRTRSYLGHRA